jgi:pyruvate/2-oxoglutarate dehydrogenase complex dihydrolipoamide dehydrogenase (E3) component
MSEQEFDVVVIGMGPGGETVAETLAAQGLAVAAAWPGRRCGPTTRPSRPRGCRVP